MEGTLSGRTDEQPVDESSKEVTRMGSPTPDTATVQLKPHKDETRETDNEDGLNGELTPLTRGTFKIFEFPKDGTDSKGEIAARVGLCSRIDYGSKGFRQGLVELGWHVFQHERVHFIVLAGGLVSFKDLKKEVPKNKAERQHFIDNLAYELANILPRIQKEDGETVKIYILTSRPYDGWIGERVANQLTRLRDDIRYYGESARFPVTQVGKVMWVLTPLKASWRTKYYSTAVDGLIEDKQKQSTQELPDIYVVGCFASSIHKPAGERKRPYITIPALHRLEEVTTSENQIGVAILEFLPQMGDGYFSRTYNFKDLVSRERDQIRPSAHATLEQQKIIEALREGPLTIGLFSERTGIERSILVEATKAMGRDGVKPPIRFDQESKRYDFELEWLQRKLRYTPSGGKLEEDAFVAFGCLHAGSVHTNYRFFVNEVPEFIVEHNARVLVGAGDFVQGLKHDLMLRGEVLGNLNYSQQEVLAARLVGSVILKVFIKRFEEKVPVAVSKPKLTNRELTDVVSDSLLEFLYIPGNHDLWQQDFGVNPLQVFRNELIRFLTHEVEDVLRQRRLYLYGLMDLVEKKIREGSVHELTSGICVEVFHPHMARAQTTSLRAQAMLEKSSCSVVVGANFHVAIAVNEWNPDIGQRSVIQVGTLVSKTEFEDFKLKRLDVGVGFLRVRSRNGKIYMTETAFFGKPEEGSLDNESILKYLLKELNI